MLKRSILFVVLFLLTAGIVLAVPTKMSYEGRLTDKSGNPLTGAYNMRFSIATDSAGSSVVWGPETHSAVSVSNGVFSVMLGETTALSASLFSVDTNYIKVEVANPADSLSNYEAMSPLTQLVSVGYAQKADTATNLSGGSITAESGSFSGNVGIGTTSPGYKLDVNKYVPGTSGGGLFRAQCEYSNVNLTEINVAKTGDIALFLQGGLSGAVGRNMPPLVDGAYYFRIGGKMHNGMVWPTDFNAGSIDLVTVKLGGNNTSSDLEFRTLSNSFVGEVADTKMVIKGNGGYVGIGTTAPQGALDVTSTTGALIVPRMTALQRTDNLTPVNGMIIYNTTTNAFNFYENGAWVTK